LLYIIDAISKEKYIIIFFFFNICTGPKQNHLPREMSMDPFLIGMQPATASPYANNISPRQANSRHMSTTAVGGNTGYPGIPSDHFINNSYMHLPYSTTMESDRRQQLGLQQPLGYHPTPIQTIGAHPIHPQESRYSTQYMGYTHPELSTSRVPDARYPLMNGYTPIPTSKRPRDRSSRESKSKKKRSDVVTGGSSSSSSSVRKGPTVTKSTSPLQDIRSPSNISIKTGTIRDSRPTVIDLSRSQEPVQSSVSVSSSASSRKKGQITNYVERQSSPTDVVEDVPLDSATWLETIPFFELEAATGNNPRAEAFLSTYRTFDDVTSWAKRKKDQRATFTISFCSTENGPGEIVAAACLFWEYINSEAYACLPYFSTMFGMRSKKLGMILVHFMLSRVRIDGYERLYLPATRKAQSFWERMGAKEIVRPDEVHTKEVIEEMHCFSSSTTALMCIELNRPYPTKPLLPDHADLEEASMAGLFFKAVRHDPLCRAAAMMEALDVQKLRNLRIKGWSPIHESVQRDDPDEAYKMTKLLLERNCLPNPMDDDWKQTPLYFAANQDRRDVAELLVECNADVNHRDVHHQPALFYAAKHNSMNIARYFVEVLGVSPNVKDKAGRRAVTYAKQSDENGSHQEIIDYLEGMDRKKAVPKATNRNGRRGGGGNTRSNAGRPRGFR